MRKKIIFLQKFQTIPIYFRVYCDIECEYEHISENRGAMNEKISYQKQVSLNHYGNSHEESDLPSGCHSNFGGDNKEWFVEEMHKP